MNPGTLQACIAATIHDSSHYQAGTIYVPRQLIFNSQMTNLSL
jgi:hypothetical protein